MLREARYYTRLAVGIGQMLRAPVPADPLAFVREHLLNRDRSFLDTLQRSVLCRSDHPYTQMLRAAGWEFRSLADHIRRDGLEATLAQLRRDGVYLSHEEWKGRQPIVRNGREIPHRPSDFRNPLASGWIESSSSGSSGSPVTTSRSPAFQVHSWMHEMLTGTEFELDTRARVNVLPILPFMGGLNQTLRGHRLGEPIDRWFAEGSTRSDAHYRAMTSALTWMGNRMGARAPSPVYLPPDDFEPVAAHIARRNAEGRLCSVHGFASPLVRVVGAARERELDVSGTLFFCLGEAMTPAKERVFAEAGGRGYAIYSISELGRVGSACRTMTGNRVHLFSDALAVIGAPRAAPYADGAEVNSLHFTTLVPYSPNVFINVEMDDEGVIETATCDCLYSRLGLTTVISDIRSFAKLSPQGMTFHGADLVHMLETVLPGRIGGAPGDYQLVECEAAGGQTELRLHVSPRVGVRDTDGVRRTFLELMRARWGGALATRMWNNSGAVAVVVAEPIATRTGKVHPVRPLNTADRSG